MCLWRRSMEDPHVQKKLNHESAPTSKGRRSFIGGVATMGAGLVSSVILPTTAIAQHAGSPPEKKSTTSGCGRARLLLPTRQLSQKQLLGKSAVSSVTGCTFSKACPMVPQPLARGASCRQSSPNLGKESGTHFNMGVCARTRILLTLILTGKTWRTPTKMRSCCIVPRPGPFQVRTACDSTYGPGRSMPLVGARSWSTCTAEDFPPAADMIFFPMTARVSPAIMVQ